MLEGKIPFQPNLVGPGPGVEIQTKYIEVGKND